MTFLAECMEVTERFPEIARDLFYIRSTNEGFIKLDANAVQAHYHRERVRRGFSSRDVILKARKRGITTWKVLEALALALFGPRGVGSAILTYEKDSAANIFRMLRWAYDRLPQDLRDARPLDEDRRDAFEIDGSTIFAFTAGSRGVARGETIHFAHLTEVSFWADPESALPGILDAVPREGHVCIESTPKGRDNYFYDLCKQAREQPDDPYRLFFYPWWWGPENAMPLREGERVALTEDESQIVRVAAADGFTLSDEQIRWRRWVNADPGRRATFMQEHPEDPETCFLVSGSPLIDPMLLRKLVLEAEATRPIETVWEPGNGETHVWKHPFGKFPYIVAVDVSEGKPHRDWSVVSTWQVRPEGLVNVKRTKLMCNGDDLADLAVKTAKEHHDALIICEVNSIGANVQRKISEDLSYWNVYFRLDREDQFYETDHPGFQSNRRTKAVMVAEFVDAVNAGDVVSWDAEMWSQLMNLTKDEFGRPMFPQKRHDDILICAMLANIARDQARVRSGGGASVVSYA